MSELRPGTRAPTPPSWRCALLALCAAACCASPLAGAAALTSTDAAAGLKKALDQGINTAVAQLGTKGGFLDNPAVRIDLPPRLARAQSTIKMLGLGADLDTLTIAMNRAAEAAVPQSKTLLKQALRDLSVSDANKILFGKDDAATQYFRSVTYAPLKEQFAPIIAHATREVRLGAAYDAVAGKAAALGLLKPEDASLESYVTEKTLDGLYTIIAQEERAIRKDPLGQASALLKRVFGAAR